MLINRNESCGDCARAVSRRPKYSFWGMKTRQPTASKVELAKTHLMKPNIMVLQDAAGRRSPLVQIGNDISSVLAAVELKLNELDETTDDTASVISNASTVYSYVPEEDDVSPADDEIVKAKEAALNRAALKKQSKLMTQAPKRLGMVDRRTSWAHTSATSRSCASQLGVDIQTVINNATAATTAALEPQKSAKKVTFGKLTVYVHHLTLGDNPGVSNGVPLQLEWKNDGTEIVDLADVDDDEPKSSMKFTSGERFRIALKRNPKNDVMKEIKVAGKIRDSRQKSQQDEVTEVETFMASRRPKKPAPAPKKRLWWYHGR